MRILTTETVAMIGETVTLKGWVHTRRDHGKIMFLDMRDRRGIVQIVATKQMADARAEDVISVTGIVKKRPDSMVNPKIETGTVEIEATEIRILNKSRELPLPIDTDGRDINEEVRLKYRYLDLRRPRLQRNIKLRSKLIDSARQYLFSQDFLEIETPLLTKSTPEGSRDFLVPSRLQPGNFYALPQSPQQYKQLLMVAGFERYFQVARCLRDEDLRADRGFEHTQIDIEMSFVKREDVMKLDEDLITHVVEALGFTIRQKPFPRISYAEAMDTYGADKFDMRSEEEKRNGILAFAWEVDFPFFEKTEDGGWTFTHNPFSSPKPEHKDMLLAKENIGDILTTQYDLVCSGYEVGGGSIRSHESKVLHTVFEIMGYENDRIESQFGHMLSALDYGCPPHGGLAHGVERLLMTLTGEPYLREVVAFPQTASGQTSVMSAPSSVDESQLSELGISVKPKASFADVYTKIVSLLDDGKFAYTTYEHAHVTTSEEAALARGTPIEEGAKALLFMTGEKPVMVVVPGDKKVDMKKCRTILESKDVRMATPDEVSKVTHVEIGAVPPLGHIFDIPLFADMSIKDLTQVSFNAGSHTKSVTMSVQEYEKFARPVFVDIAK